MNNKIHDAFDKIHAEDALKKNTADFLYQKTHGYKNAQTSENTVRHAAAPGIGNAPGSGHALNDSITPGHKKSFLRHRLPAAVICAAAAVLAFFGIYFYAVPVSAITLSVNPEVELAVNRADRVISVKAGNEDGRLLASSVNVFFMNYKDALDSLMESSTIKACIASGKSVSILVSGENEEKGEEMLASISECPYARQPSVTCRCTNRKGSSHAESEDAAESEDIAESEDTAESEDPAESEDTAESKCTAESECAEESGCAEGSHGSAGSQGAAGSQGVAGSQEAAGLQGASASQCVSVSGNHAQSVTSAASENEKESISEHSSGKEYHEHSIEANG